MERVLVGVDDALTTGTAVRWGSRLAAACGAEVIVVNAWQHPGEPSDGAQHDERLDERRERMDRLWSREARSEGAAVRSAVFDGDPREVLPEVADAEDVDLLVVARSGAEGEAPGLLHLGSVAEYLAHTVTRPLAVIPVDGPSRPPTRVLLGVDGSDASRAASAWCADVAAVTGASVIAANVQAPLTERNREGTPDDWLHYVAQQDVTTWASPITDAGVDLSPEAVRAVRAADGLLALTATHTPDLLVVGTRGVGGFTGLRIGGTALRLLHRCTLPLVVVPGD